MENVLNEQQVQKENVKKEASQKSMIALVTVTGLLCLGVACAMVWFTTIFTSL